MTRRDNECLVNPLQVIWRKPNKNERQMKKKKEVRLSFLHHNLDPGHAWENMIQSTNINLNWISLYTPLTLDTIRD